MLSSASGDRKLKSEAGKVYLVGAGPGDPKLLTIRAAEALGASDVIVYDYLVNPAVLAHSRRDAELVYAGKRAGERSMAQTDINRLLIARARRGQVVARLKGGDPFIFGRGGEEAEALASAGIKWEVIPGISSGVAAAAYAGIPLTHRAHSSSVAFLTGHRANDVKDRFVNWRAAACAADTLVIFMCASNIAEIARELVAGARAPATPAAIVRWGTYEHQEVFAGTIQELIAAADCGFRIQPPAVAIIGDVVKLAPRLAWFGNDYLRHSLDRAELGACVPAPGD
jgi:uroporphyrin-III C-methyltransferase